MSGFRTADAYLDLKMGVMNSLNKIPVYGNKMVERIRKTKSGIKQLFIPGMLFEEMGIIYLGPVDGSDMKGILRLLKEASNIEDVYKRQVEHTAADQCDIYHSIVP